MSAKVSFQNFKKVSSYNENLFKVPDDYTEDKIDLIGAVIEKQKQQQQSEGAPKEERSSSAAAVSESVSIWSPESQTQNVFAAVWLKRTT